MPKTIYLHIGMHKTGSSTIQEGLYQNRKQLEARGYVYPCLRNQEVAHHNLVWELKQNDQFDLDDLRTFIEHTHHNNIIISSEFFSLITTQDLRQLKAHLRVNQIKIVVYLRRQDQRIQSMWAQNIKAGTSATTFEEFFNSLVFRKLTQLEQSNEKIKNNRAKYSRTLHYDKFLMPYVDIFGQENIIVHAYERSYMNKNIVADFLASIGMNDVAWVPEKSDSNVSPSIKTLEFLRQLALGWQTIDQGREFISTLPYEEYFSELEQIADKLGWNDQRLNLIDQAKYDQVMQVYGEGNDRVAKQYLGRDQLFREPFVDQPITSFTVNDFSTEDLMPMMQEMTAKHLWILKTQPHNQSQAEQPISNTNQRKTITQWLRSLFRG